MTGRKYISSTLSCRRRIAYRCCCRCSRCCRCHSPAGVARWCSASTRNPTLLQRVYGLHRDKGAALHVVATAAPPLPLRYNMLTLLSRWKGWQGPRQGRSQASPQDLARQHPGYHQARYPSSRASWWCQAYLGQYVSHSVSPSAQLTASSDLRGDPWCPEDFPRERHSRCCHLH